MKKPFIFLISLFVLMGIGLAFHLQFNQSAKFFLIQSYSINTLMAAAAILLLSYGIDKKTANLVVLYIFTVALKFSAYFIFFYPKFNWDGVMYRQEFFLFFTPYAIGLFLEIFILAKSIK